MFPDIPAAATQAPPKAVPPLPVTALLSLSASAAVTLVTELLPVGVLPQMSAALHVSPASVGALATGYAAAAAVAAVPLTALTRALDRRRLLVVLLAMLALANVATAASASYPVVLAVRIVAGLANGVVWSMLASYAAGIVPAGQRGRAVSITLAGITIALSGGVPAATALASGIGWRATFAAVAGATALAAACVAATAPPLRATAAGGQQGLAAVLRLPGTRAVLATTALLLAGHQAAYTYIAPVTRALGLGHASVTLLAFGGCAVAGTALTAIVIDNHLRLVMLAAVTLIVGALLALALGTRHAAALAAVGAWGIGFGSAPAAIQTALIRAAGEGNAETATALQTTTYNAAIAVGSLLGSIALSADGEPAVPWAALALATATLAHVTTRRQALTPAAAIE